MDITELFSLRGETALVTGSRAGLGHAMALEVCDRIYVLVDGRIIDEKRTSEMGDDGRALIDAYLG